MHIPEILAQSKFIWSDLLRPQTA